MIYLDNAATTKYKPDCVYEAVNYYLREIGVSPGRGSYNLGVNASRMLYQTRKAVGKYFGLSKPQRVVFTKNSTEAINLFFNGFLKHGDHVVISCYEHNAVFRPLNKLVETRDIEVSVVSREDLTLNPEEIYKKYAKANTKLLAFTLASNLTGRIIYSKELFKVFHDKGIITFVDSSQGAGKCKLNMTEDYIDYLAFTGHKDLFAIPGVGGLCCGRDDKLCPLIQGGTGVHGEEYINPSIFPEGLESGTLNMPAIWSLHESINYLNDNFFDIVKHDNELKDYMMYSLKSIPKIRIYDSDCDRVSTCCFTIEGIPTNKVIEYLNNDDICVRGGIHCAILAHEALGTVNTGTVRVSLGIHNSKNDIDALIVTLKNFVTIMG